MTIQIVGPDPPSGEVTENATLQCGSRESHLDTTANHVSA